MKLKLIVSIALMALLCGSAHAYNGEAYVTPDSWSKHITANGVKASSKGIELDNGKLTIGLTTRAALRFSDNTDTNIYQYFRARLSDVALGNGTVSLNVNMRGAWNGSERSSNLREYYVYYDSLDIERDQSNDFSLRIYQANLRFDNVIKYTDLTLGRLYMTSFDGYKIDGGKVAVTPLDLFTVYAFYGLPVSYYTNLKTQVVGGGVEIPLFNDKTRIKAEYAYFIHSDEEDYSNGTFKARLDQDIYFAHLYAETTMIEKAWTTEIGVDGNIAATKTGFSAYARGQSGRNSDNINPYLSLFESELGEGSEYLMGGFQVYQGITDYFMLTAGFEGRYNTWEAYGDRDYYRVFATADIIGLIHRNNFLSIIADWYTVNSYEKQDRNSKLLLGARMTQVVADGLDLWVGANVMNYQYKSTPIKLNKLESSVWYPESFRQYQRNENTTLAYIGGGYSPTDWCMIQLDYTFEYSTIFEKYGERNDDHMIELWVNFMW